MKKILWLASWYPSKVDPYTGDFVERHARAAALESQITVLHVLKDNDRLFSQKILEVQRRYTENVKASVIYYQSPVFGIHWIEKLYSNYLYLKLHIKFFKNYIRENGKPDGIHVHIGLKAGMAALLLKYIYRTSYVVSEHWSGLCPEAHPGFNEKPFIYRWIWKRVMRNASGYSAVSAYLADSIQKVFGLKKVDVIPNVVDEELFYPSGNSVYTARFIHISTLKYQKNPEQMLEAAAILKDRLPGFSLWIFGEPNETLVNLANQLNLGNSIEFKGTCSQDILRGYIQESVALILYSRFESFGCVVIEANACGKPVIVSDIPVLHENVKEGITGLFVPLNNPGLLAEAMYVMAMGNLSFDEKVLQKWALDFYSFKKVGKQFTRFYENYFK